MLAQFLRSRVDRYQNLFVHCQGFRRVGSRWAGWLMTSGDCQSFFGSRWAIKKILFDDLSLRLRALRQRRLFPPFRGDSEDDLPSVWQAIVDRCSCLRKRSSLVGAKTWSGCVYNIARLGYMSSRASTRQREHLEFRSHWRAIRALRLCGSRGLQLCSEAAKS